MPAANTSRDLRDKFDRIIRDGNQQYREGRLLDALVTYAQCWAIADTAATCAPSRQYADWSLRRKVAADTLKIVRAKIEADKCCFDGCPKPATQKFGNGVYFPMCDEHASRVKP